MAGSLSRISDPPLSLIIFEADNYGSGWWRGGGSDIIAQPQTAQTPIFPCVVSTMTSFLTHYFILYLLLSWGYSIILETKLCFFYITVFSSEFFAYCDIILEYHSLL